MTLSRVVVSLALVAGAWPEGIVQRSAEAPPRDQPSISASSGGAGRAAPRAVPRVVPNDNRRPAGRRRDGVHVVRLVAQAADWRPDLEGPAIPIFAFAEEGEAPRIPGPLIRVRAGTELRVSVRNDLAKPMLVRGLHDRPAAQLEAVEIAPGGTHDFSFRATAPGTYYYSGRTEGERRPLAAGIDGQLLGAIVVDPAEGKVRDDRIWVMGLWVEPPDSVRQAAGFDRRETMVMNGLTWPHTERTNFTVGDSVRWRVINGNARSHPMHLHGFYYTVESTGSALADTLYTREQQRLAVTERMGGGGTLTFTWVPTRAGNWLFHCHLIDHVSPHLRLATRPPHDGSAHGGGKMSNHALEGMAGLVVGIHVKPRRGEQAMPPDPVARRHLRLFVNERANVYGTMPGYAYVLQEGDKPPAPDSLVLPSSPIVLTRGEPAEITVVNRTSRPATIHWHGIELESFYDGVADWSGWGSRTAPPIPAGGSFAVRLTPDRAGTFIYHTHSEEGPQLASGLYGPLLIREPGEQVDPDIDRVILLGVGGPGRDPPPVINGAAAPPPMEFRAGTTYRLRFINITPDHFREVRLLSDSATVVRWRFFAKDGAYLPPHQATERPAHVRLGAGETYDYEFTPAAAGTLTMEVISSGLGRPPTTMTVQVNVRAP